MSHNVELITLKCSDNFLRELNVSSAVNLASLYCDNNQLEALDITQNPKLRELSCTKNFFPDQSAIIGLDEGGLMKFAFKPQRKQ